MLRYEMLGWDSGTTLLLYLLCPVSSSQQWALEGPGRQEEGAGTYSFLFASCFSQGHLGGGAGSIIRS